MLLKEIIDFDAAERNVKLMKQNAKLLIDKAKQAQAQLNIKKAQQRLIQARKPVITITP